MFSELWLDHVSAHKSLGPAARAVARKTLELERESRRLHALGQIEESESQRKGLPTALLRQRPAGFSPETHAWGKMSGQDKAQEVPSGCVCPLLQLLLGKAALKVKSQLQACDPHEQVERGPVSSLQLWFHRNDLCSPSISAALGTWLSGGARPSRLSDKDKTLGEPAAQGCGGVCGAPTGDPL